MRITAILNLKGGVAKTTTAINMAAILAQDHKKRVLLIDADSQCNSTDFYGGAMPGRCTMSDLLRRTDVNSPILESSFPGVDIIPADDSLMDLDLSKVENKTVDVQCLSKLLKRVTRYDYVLIDCPPAFNAATAAALLAADDVVIPIKLDAFAIQGMANLMRQVENMKRVNPRLRVAGILPVMWYRSAKVAAAESMLRESKLHIFSHIRRSPTVDAMTYSQIPLCAGSRNSGAGRDYKDFVEEYLGGEE